MFHDIDYLFEFVDDLPIGIASADISGENPTKYNKFFLEMFGYSQNDIDTIDKWYKNAYPDEKYRNHIKIEWSKVVEFTEKNHLNYSKPIDAKIACKDGSYKWCESRYYRKGDIVYGIFVDITETKKAHQELINLSIIDDLTKIKNRRAYNEKIENLIFTYNRFRSPTTVAIFDIDNFKKINDTFGHKMGDKVLIELSSLVSNTLREFDSLYRVGGEEFVIILENTKLSYALDIMNKLIKNIESDINLLEDRRVTISMGLSQIKEEDTTGSIYKRVDELLYQAKESGKNRVISDN
jgi:diguanylate cyclase (GGDEF)-like protein